VTHTHTLIAFLLVALFTQGSIAQTNDILPESIFFKGTSADTNTAASLSSTGTSIRITSLGSRSLLASDGGTLTIPESGGKATYITATADGGLIIREPGPNNSTYVIPRSDGGLVVRGPDRTSIYVTPVKNDYVKISGPRFNRQRTNVTSSPDGKSITIWTRGGKTYEVTLPTK